jgi:hypothetical protein
MGNRDVGGTHSCDMLLRGVRCLETCIRQPPTERPQDALPTWETVWVSLGFQPQNLKLRQGICSLLYSLITFVFLEVTMDNNRYLTLDNVCDDQYCQRYRGGPASTGEGN